MTNHWIDYKNSDVFLAFGCNPAENHPISMKWIERARAERDAKLIVVDPRFTRTAAVADLYAPLRPGTNIAFLGGLINYVLSNKLYHEEYVLNYTNATYLINPEFSFADGLFSGAQEAEDRAATYDKSSWSYQLDADGNIKKDPTATDPHCVLQLMKKHYERYDLETVSRITGCPVDKLQAVAELYASTGQAGKAGNILYAMGVTQFTHGSQNVRAIACLQLLLGNIGIPGGGVNAQRGQANVQGSTDMAMLYHIIPGYLNMPKASLHENLAAYLEKETPASSYWANKPKFLISMLKAWYGDHAVEENDFCFDYLPKLDDKDRSHIGMYKYMGEGEIKGMICWADNPAVTGPSASAKREYTKNLDWLVSIDIFENETAAFWKEPGVDPTEIDTEVFLLPGSASFEREGTISNSGRWIQWRYQAQKPLGDAKTDIWIVDQLYKAIRAEYEKNAGPFADPILKLTWDYGEEADANAVAMEVNGYDTRTGQLLENFTKLADDGSTACGCWIYSGYYNNATHPACKSRIREESGIGTNAKWAFAWPLNRRIIYNRCSADLQGNPWNPETPLMWWDGEAWQCNDVPDFNANVPPEATAQGPYIMLPELQARLFASGMAEGPFPEHYEPAESPIRNLLSGTVQFNPVTKIWYQDHLAAAGDQDFPYIMSTYRVTEHWQSGIMTRNTPWLNELMPALFVEISPTLAEKLGIENGDQVEISTYRKKKIAAIACVTARIKPLLVDGELREIVGMPFHWGFMGLNKGAIVNDIVPSIGDANTNIPEYKAFLCNIRKVG